MRKDALILLAHLIRITVSMPPQDKSFQEERTDMAVDITQRAAAARDVTFARDFFVPTVAVSVLAAILYPAVEDLANETN